jgi:hypothetical protein
MISLAESINFGERVASRRASDSLLYAGNLGKKKIMISREEARTIASIPGNIRGSAFLSDAENLKRRLGAAGMQKVLKAMAAIGYPMAYEKMRAMQWYPLGLRLLSFAVLQDVFAWTGDDFREMGDNAPKYSFIVKLMMKFFISPEAAFRRAPEYWKRHYSTGTLEIGTFDESAKEVILRLKDFNAIRAYRSYLEGFFRRLMQYLLPADDVRCEEKECKYEGAQCHEFRITW